MTKEQKEMWKKLSELPKPAKPGVLFNVDGTKMMLDSPSGALIYQLSTPWDIKTATAV